jgi:hypothetical protein
LCFVKIVESQPDVEQRALFDALREAMSIARTIESELCTRGDAAWHDTVFLGSQVNPIAHRLLSTPERYDEKENSPVSTAIRLGIILFIIIIKQQSQGCPAPSTPYVSKAVGLLSQGTPKILLHMSLSLYTLQLWLLLLCIVAYPDTTLLPEIYMMVMRIKSQLKLNSWDEVLAVARLMPWIGKFEFRKGFRECLTGKI